MLISLVAIANTVESNVSVSNPGSAPSIAQPLTPSFAIPISLVVIAIPFIWIQVWLAVALSVFGLFLLIQTVTLQLWFTADALDIYRGTTLIRRFPYREWQNWEIFWSPVPILFYFKEIKSIHFLPIIFNPQQLRAALEEHVPRT